MKNLIYTLAITFCLTLGLQAKIITVSNLGGANYTNLTDAYNAAIAGDTIYIEPTNFNHGNITSNKRLTWVGTGWNPATTNGYISIINSVFIESGADSSRFYGLFFNDYLSTDPATVPIGHLFIENCMFNNYIDLNDGPIINCVIRNTVFPRISSPNVYLYDADSIADRSNIIFISCYFNGHIEGYMNPFNLITLDHCIWAYNDFSRISNALVRNSVIYTGTSTVGGSNNLFFNNIFYYNTSLGVANSGSGNYFNTNPQMVNPGGNFYWSHLEDYHLQPGSAGINAAIDGSNIGIHGGSSNFSMSGEPLWIPIVRSLNFQGAPVPLVQPGDTLNITIEASRPQMD